MLTTMALNNGSLTYIRVKRKLTTLDRPIPLQELNLGLAKAPSPELGLYRNPILKVEWVHLREVGRLGRYFNADQGFVQV